MEQRKRYRKDRYQEGELQGSLEQEKKLQRIVDGHEKVLENRKRQKNQQ